MGNLVNKSDTLFGVSSAFCVVMRVCMKVRVGNRSKSKFMGMNKEMGTCVVTYVKRQQKHRYYFLSFEHGCNIGGKGTVFS